MKSPCDLKTVLANRKTHFASSVPGPVSNTVSEPLGVASERNYRLPNTKIVIADGCWANQPVVQQE